MRRLVTALSAAALAVAMTVPAVSAQEGQWIDGIVVNSATLDRTGMVKLTGTLYCQNMDSMQVEMQGQLRQAIGHKTTIQGSVWGGFQCSPNGPTSWEAWSRADWGSFSNGWVTVEIGFGWNFCNENGCWWQDFGYVNTLVKVARR